MTDIDDEFDEWLNAPEVWDRACSFLAAGPGIDKSAEQILKDAYAAGYERGQDEHCECDEPALEMTWQRALTISSVVAATVALVITGNGEWVVGIFVACAIFEIIPRWLWR